MKKFEGKKVIVSAAASGIGAATALKFLDEGAYVGIVDINKGSLDLFLEQNKLFSERITVGLVDVSIEDDVKKYIDEFASRNGSIDILVNNAGLGAYGSIEGLSTERWNHVISISLSSVFYFTKHASAYLKPRESSIINVASISGANGDYGFSAYAAAKGGVINLTKTLALDFSKKSIRVNSVSPGLVDTPLTKKFFDKTDLMKDYFEKIPMSRAAKPCEIASVIAFLASNDASYITGQNIVVDGGLSAWTGQPNFEKYIG